MQTREFQIIIHVIPTLFYVLVFAKIRYNHQNFIKLVSSSEYLFNMLGMFV